MTTERPALLVIDADPAFINVMRGALTADYELLAAATAREAIGKLKQGGVAAIVLGYLDPRGASFELYRLLKGDPVTQAIPLLVVDVRPEEHLRKGWTRKQGLRLGGDDYISRPVDPSDLKDILQRTLRRASSEPMDLEEASRNMQKALERINRIEELL